ncbi:hypothetical protein RS84_02744 [Microbacterium hydrocarbonoxydans]|uniref:Uncharacterized protein n=1 Tax=Microbacterium hydrocarbonoxydans TaxID=273678 RepID=A0A0M2HNR0_9MICO|nr:hypothetical protein RS84_02744 [Microbacterium hydrocarbonoxydans]
MSVLYRAVWSDTSTTDRVLAVERLKRCVAAWTQESNEPEALSEGQSDFDVSQGRHREVVLRSLGEDGFEVTATDQVFGDPTDWVTVVRVVADDDGIHTLVELSMSSEDLARRVSVGRPKLVHDLLGAVEKPHLGGSGLLTEPLALPAIGVGVLTDMLANPARTLPIIVCAEPNGRHDGSWLQTASTIAARAEGIAAVVTLDHAAVAAFKDEFGQLAIWDGGIRIYAPGVVTKHSDGWRHRYYVRSRLEEFLWSTVDRIVYSVAQLSTRRRVPDAFRVFGQQNGLPADALDGMVPVKDLTEARDQWEFELEVARDEQSSVERELASANGHLSRIKDALLAQGLSDLFWGSQHAEAASIPDEVQYTSEAALAAQIYLSEWLSVPNSAIRELDDIDTAAEAYNWGNKTWRGLRALAAYAKDRAEGWDKGGFWEWCASGPVLGWPATPKKLAMTESEGVQNGGKFKGTRDFKIDTEVDPTGVITMLSHLKISEGGGNLAPRVYFHDDTSGPTKKVHVGLIGPHYLVPNKSTN